MLTWLLFGVSTCLSCISLYFLSKKFLNKKKKSTTTSTTKDKKHFIIKTFHPPDEVFMYDNNAFQVLGLIPFKANKIRIISKRKDELSNLIKAGLEPQKYLQDYYVIPWPNSQPITEFIINDAYSRLENNLKRIKEELFWFHLEENNMNAFEYLKKGDFESAKKLWEEEKSNSQTYRGAFALHNLAVLEHALVLSEERSITSNPGMSPEQIKKWKRVFALWVEVYKNDKCWDYLRQRIIYLNDPRINEDYIRQLRKDLPRMVLEINLAIARAGLSQEFFEYAKQHLDLLKNSGFDSEDINKALKSFFALFVKNMKMIRERIEDLSRNEKTDELYKEYINLLNKAIKIKKQVDMMEGVSYIKEEIDQIISILNKQIYKEIDPKIEKIIEIKEKAEKIKSAAMILIEEWNKGYTNKIEIAIVFKTQILSMNDELEKDISKIDISKTKDIIRKSIEVFGKAEKLCCTNESRLNIRNNIDGLNKLNEVTSNLNNEVATLSDSLNKVFHKMNSEIAFLL